MSVDYEGLGTALFILGVAWVPVGFFWLGQLVAAAACAIASAGILVLGAADTGGDA